MKKKQNNGQQHQSPESYIKARARKLPLGTSYISSDWKESGLANILITRKHVNGNVTVGAYLVDLYCLGVKQCYYFFNLSPHQFDDILTEGDVAIDYNTVHNILYGAVEYAEELGFKPAKDWSIAEFILEPDDDNVPLVDIEFGRDGKPFFVPGPGDQQYKIMDILNTLVKNVGIGNFYFDDSFINDANDDDFEDDEEIDELDYEHLFEDEKSENIDIEDYIDFEEEKDEDKKD
ncbi:hypothetical protein [Polluticaenibacter yanchengensis]|uniref:Uncharacterized protein n=1 Tax=Polluticaenibacter yanchengensis TaxID=3014562 RepID=A0ABT4UJ30_9BACT|nr:hypothetical protein [Chitinophagaceae bacterium LY-5]